MSDDLNSPPAAPAPECPSWAEAPECHALVADANAAFRALHPGYGAMRDKLPDTLRRLDDVINTTDMSPERRASLVRLRNRINAMMAPSCDVCAARQVPMEGVERK